MLLVAAHTLSDVTPSELLKRGSLYANQSSLRDVSFKIAMAVVKEARDSGVGRLIPDDKIEETIQQTMWSPMYPSPEEVGAP